MSTYYIVRDELSHYGVKGMKWGVRKQLPLIGRSRNSAQISDAKRASIKKQRAKKAAIIGGSIVAAGLIAYGGYKLNGVRKAAITSLGKKYMKQANQWWDIRGIRLNSAHSSANMADKYKIWSNDSAYSKGEQQAFRKAKDELMKTSSDYYKSADEATDQWLEYYKKAKNKKYTNKEVAKEMIEQIKKRK